jgi:hypothetical protein
MELLQYDLPHQLSHQREDILDQLVVLLLRHPYYRLYYRLGYDFVVFENFWTADMV